MSREPRTVSLPVDEVVLTEDRAQVIRRGRLTLTGSETVRVVGVSPLAVDATLLARVTEGQAVLGAATLHRRFDRAPNAREQTDDELSVRLEERQARVAEAEAAKERAEHAAEAMDAAGRLWVAARQRAWRLGHEVEAPSEDLSALTERATAAAARVAEAARLLADAKRELDQVRDLRARRASEQRLSGRIELALDGHGEVAIELSYLVPSALWRPTHEAELRTGDDERVSWRLLGSVWQRTGEDWTGVKLTLSTARSSAGTVLPPLEVDGLATRDRSRQERRHVAAAFQEQAISSTTVGGAEPDALPGVHDGGEVRVFDVPGRHDLPSDGRPRRVLVERFESPSKSRWVCVPERAEGVYRQVSLRNRMGGGRPLLAGPVGLLVDGAYVGIGELPYVGPGETFGLGFGTHDEVVVRYERKRETDQRFAREDRVWFLTTATLDHTGAEPLTVEVQQRVPVSELEQVRVVRGPQSTEGASGPDGHGHVRWTVELAPGQREKVTAAFRLERVGKVELADPW